MPSNTGCAVEHQNQSPMALRLPETAAAAEKAIADAIPQVVGKLVSMAMEGNVAAARYLVDRVLGRVAKVYAPAEGAQSEILGGRSSQPLKQARKQWEMIGETGVKEAKVVTRAVERSLTASMPGIGRP